MDRFARKHADARKRLAASEKAVRFASWNNLVELQSTFGTADLVQGKVVFDIGGNRYRLITLLDYRAKTLLVIDVLTHGEYDKGKWK